MLAPLPKSEVEAVFLRAAILAEALADASERQGQEEEAAEQREAAAKVRSLLAAPERQRAPGA